jgi:hypothetical protein
MHQSIRRLIRAVVICVAVSAPSSRAAYADDGAGESAPHNRLSAADDVRLEGE